MTQWEPARRALYNCLEEVLGDQNAETLMSSLPMHPMSDLATRPDLDRLEGRFGKLEQRFEKLEGKFEKLEGKFERLEDKVDKLSEEMRSGFTDVYKAIGEQQATYAKLTIGAMTALTAIFSLIVGLIT